MVHTSIHLNPMKLLLHTHPPLRLPRPYRIPWAWQLRSVPDLFQSPPSVSDNLARSVANQLAGLAECLAGSASRSATPARLASSPCHVFLARSSPYIEFPTI
ncbi:hypothetical protein DY000_02048820 [Brassica cretica]|uniref:Uncharacterized protein n=1 Tax=Brassica cretica TaxID=69181 RepID=A0ABQ7FCG1_BRACR|nr:hypothetical protein DY000_02048820 [Brassica cretica]